MFNASPQILCIVTQCIGQKLIFIDKLSFILNL